MTFDVNVLLAALSLALFLGLIGFFAFLIRHQNEVEPEEKTVEGVELIRQHYGAGDTIEQPTPYYVAPIPSSPDPLEIAGNLDKKIVLGGFMLFASFALIGAYLFALLVVRADASSGTWRDRVAEEHQLHQRSSSGRPLTDDERARLAELEVRLDQCWDLLRRRRALRSAGRDPDEAAPQDASVVEGYRQ